MGIQRWSWRGLCTGLPFHCLCPLWTWSSLDKPCLRCDLGSYSLPVDSGGAGILSSSRVIWVFWQVSQTLSETGQVLWVSLITATCCSRALPEQLKNLGKSCSRYEECWPRREVRTQDDPSFLPHPQKKSSLIFPPFVPMKSYVGVPGQNS